MKNLASAAFITACLYSYVYPLSTFARHVDNVQDVREVVVVSQKKHIEAEHVKGFDTYDNPIDYHVQEQFILRFKNRNGYFVVPKELFDRTKIGDKFVTEDDRLYYCRRSDGCYD